MATLKLSANQGTRYEFIEAGTYEIAIVNPIVAPGTDRVTICVEPGDCQAQTDGAVRCKDRLFNGATGDWQSNANGGCTLTAWKASGGEIPRINHDPNWQGDTAEWDGGGFHVRLQVTKIR